MFARQYTKRIDYFAYPRVGSHYLFHCLSGLYNIVMYDMECLQTEETIRRKEELQSEAIYALGLQDPAKPQPIPVHIDPVPNGIHGLPTFRGLPIICLSREPHATVYSLYRLEQDRMHKTIEKPKVWLQKKFNDYENFYRKAVNLQKQKDESFELIRFEDLVEDENTLIKLSEFIGLEPKLDPQFVHSVTMFDRLTIKRNRTFYRAGNNERWREDTQFRELITSLDIPEIPEFGYTNALF
jgi:hypothetical protein